MEAMKVVNDAKALTVLKAADEFLKKDPRVQAKRVGSIGWCFGGTWSLRTALAIPDLSACVLYYGSGITTDPKELKKIKCPVLAIFGDRDQSLPAAKVEAFDKGLTEAGVRHEILRFDADHAFANPSGERYDEKSAAKAWENVREFLGRELKRGG